MEGASCLVLPVPFPVAICSRPYPNGAGTRKGSMQILIFSNDRDALFGSESGARSCVFELESDGNDASGPFRLSARALELKGRGPNGELKPYSCQVALHRAVYDPYSEAVYFVEGRALMRLGSDDVVAPLAGHRELCGATDGPGTTARFQLPHSVVSDGCGSLFVADCGTVRRVLLPGQDAPPGAPATVTTVYGGPWSAGFVDVAYDSTNSRLYVATISAVYRLSDQGRVPTRVAGCEGGLLMSYSVTRSATAAGGGGGRAGTAGSPTSPSPSCRRFAGISGLVADSAGGLLIADRQEVYRLEPDGGSGSVICLGKSDTSWGAAGSYPAVLPNGWLALCQYHDRRVLLLHMGRHLGLRHTLVSPPAPRAPFHEGMAGLVSDLGSLLASPDGSDDAEVVVGGRVFRCHRLILAARCLYFRRLYAGGFADSGTRQVVLQDAEPDAFASLLRYLYTGDLAFPAPQLRNIAVLADRLLLNQVVSHVHRRLLAAAHPSTVVADLLWAHQHNFEELLASLKGWYLENQASVLAADPDSVRQLFVAAPSLMYELHCATVRQVGHPPGATNSAITTTTTTNNNNNTNAARRSS